MMENLIGVFCYSLIYVVLFSIGEYCFLKLEIRAEYTRKMIHIISGLIALSFPWFLDSSSVFILCLSFLFILLWSKRNKQLQGINCIERKSFGSELFPLSVLLCFYVYKSTDEAAYYYLPIAILTLSDPIAAIVGQHTNSCKIAIGNQTKSLIGTMTFIASALIISIVLNYYFSFQYSVVLLVIVSISSGVIELYSRNGFDNITIPMSVISVLCCNKLIHS